MWRFHLMTLPGRVWVDRSMPLQNAQVTEAVSGAAAISGFLPANYAELASVKEWGALIVAEKDGSAPVACIVDGVTTEGSRLKVEAGGFSMYPTGMPWTDADYAGIQVDPLDLVRMIWSSLQSKPSGDLQVVVDSTKSSVRLGKPEDPKLTAAKEALSNAEAADREAKVTYTQAAIARNSAADSLLAAAGLPTSGLVFVQDSAPSGTHRSTRNLWIDKNDSNKPYTWNGKKWVLSSASQATINSRLSTYNAALADVKQAGDAWKARRKELAAAKKRKSDIRDGEADPWTLTWWENFDLGQVISTLAKDTPFEYREVSAWSGEGITHRLELGTPTLGSRRTDLRFQVGVNVTVRPALNERDYASEVTVLGSGEGRKMVRATSAGNPGRLRRAVVVQRKEIGKVDSAAARARTEVASRAAEWVFDSLSVSDHTFAPYGSFRPGDVVYVAGDVGWRKLDLWVRILEINTNCNTGDIELKVEAT